MKIKLERKYFKDTYTIGKLYIDNTYFCDTLEDKNRDINKNGKFDGLEQKVYAQTCIPFGTYQVIVNVSPKFKRKYPRLLNVPHFEGILIHGGKTERNSAGCILIGENNKVGQLENSSKYVEKLIKIIEDEYKKGNKVYIEIV